ncbi:hypothetical protein NQ317_011448 [Molorchus minor]|uniref:Uncharacterized protein n=1 Tax=Molorchus minor TaxID=1323400 RepID=A0ABQ9IUZ6_9CUCU|nr:hypothetical protein NQ317_011448 [Molorchus minor]
MEIQEKAHPPEGYALTFHFSLFLSRFQIFHKGDLLKREKKVFVANPKWFAFEDNDQANTMELVTELNTKKA